jgi:hypothetical protein
VVLGLLRVDPASRTVWLTGAGRERGDPYFRYLYSVKLDGSDLKLLTPDSANHDIRMAPGGAHFVDIASTPDRPP